MNIANPVVHILDDEDAVRHSLAFLLINAGYTVRVHETCGEFLARIEQGQKLVLVADLRMPDMDGLELLEALKSNDADAAAVMISGETDVTVAVKAMKAGAVDFLQKPFSEDDLLQAVETARDRLSRGDGHDHPGLVTERLKQLTKREREVLDAVIEGLPNKLIAYRLSISPRTVEIYRASLMSKLKAKSLPQLVRMVLNRPDGAG